MRFIYALIITLFSVNTLAQVTDLEFMERSPYIKGFEEVHKDGVQLIGAHKYSEAWKLLLPSAKNGDTNSMYILGKMIITTPKYFSKMKTARKLLTKAAEGGHPLAIHALKELNAIETVEQIAQRTIPNLTIDNEAKRKYEEALQRMAEKESAKSWTAEYIVFMRSFDPRYNGIIDQLNELQVRLKGEINVRYVFVAMMDDIKSKNNVRPVPGFNAPTQGFELDSEGQLARKMGVTSFPSIVGTSKSGNKTFVVTGQSNITKPLMAYYRTSVK